MSRRGRVSAGGNNLDREYIWRNDEHIKLEVDVASECPLKVSGL